jgi:hypothetical protein
VFAGLFFDLQAKCAAGEISSRPLDLRGLLDALDMARLGLDVRSALDLGIVNKSFDEYERTLVGDVLHARIPAGLTGSAIFKS